jgi:Holliday junction resolvasome RuvABC DNA-binding subunit
MPTLQIDPDLINKLIKSGRIADVVSQIEGVDPEIAAKIKIETSRLINTPLEQFEKFAQEKGLTTMGAIWSAMWEGLWTVTEPILPALYHYFGQLDAVKQMATQKAFKELRPTPLDVGTAIKFLHFMPDEQDEAIENFKLLGYSDERIRQYIIAGREALNENDIKELKHRNIFTEEDATKRLEYLGYFVDDAKAKQNSWTTLLDAGTIRNLYLRGIIQREDAVEQLQSLGYSSTNSDNIIKLFFFIPPVQDLVTMSVREVFTPEVASRFGQFDDFPEEFVEHAESQGISREWAKRYWAAHWDLPSIQMGFEMLHRGVIDQPDLDMLLKAKDVMPFWRDKLTAISYNPLTRVDVRRMHAMGVLSAEDVKRSYLDVGYNEHNADLMTSFTIAYNTQNERDLSKSEIVNSYINKIINQDDAFQMLFDMGYDEREAAMIVMLAEIKQDNKIKKARIKAIKNKFVKGVISLSQVNTDLNALNLDSGEIDVIVEDITIAKTDKAEELSLKDLKSAFKKLIIKEPEFKSYLTLKGFGEKEIDILVKLSKVGG